VADDGPGKQVTKAGKRATQFQRASDGSMTLFEHLRELRGRLFKASLGVLIGTVVGLFAAPRVIDFLNAPYCAYQRAQTGVASCSFSATGGPLDPFLLQLKAALYLGLVISAPVWLYQLWAFIAPGLHRRERRYTYIFVAVAAPLFLAGVLLAHLIVSKSLHFFLGTGHFAVIVDVTAYFSFVTNMMLLFGAAFEFPLLIVMLNMVGMVSGRRLLRWWRPAIFLMFLFGAIVTPTPDPFGMSILAACMAMLYFAAVGVALYHDRRKARRALYAGLADNEASPLTFDDSEPIEPGAPVSAPEPVAPARPITSGYDDFT
jgi:sec-independent protein translocase protein TatC